jgi:hypothetical protein
MVANHHESMASNTNLSTSKVIPGETGGYFNKSIKNENPFEPSISRIPEEMHNEINGV